MKTNLTNFFNYAAKEPQNTGGGSSQCALRSEGARQRVSESETRGVNHAIITQLSRNNHPITHRAIRYVAVLLAVFMVGIGQMWATEYALLDHSKKTLTGEFVCNPATPTNDAQTFSGKTFACYIKTTGNMTSWSSGAAEAKTIDYDLKTTSTTFTIYVGNTSSSTPQLYYVVYDESTSAHSSPDVAQTAIGDAIPKGNSMAQYTTRSVTISRSKNARVCFYTSQYNYTQIYQIIANETGTPLPKVGEGGYSLNMNKGRFAVNASKTAKVDHNLVIAGKDSYTMAGASQITLAKSSVSTQYFNFTTPSSPGKLKLTYSDGQMAYNNSASATGATDIISGTEYTLSGSTEYYLINTSTSKGSTITKIEFVAASGGGDPTTYSVTYDGNGNTSGDEPTDSDSPYTSGSSVTVLGKGTLVKENCVFAGWNTAANGSGTWYDPNASFSMGSSNVTLYAQWAACINTLDFGTIAAGISSPDLAKTQSNLTTNNVKHVIAGNTRYDTSSGYQGLKFRNSGDWIGFGVAAGNSVTITTQTVSTSPAVSIDFASATTLSANKDNDYAANNDKARYFRVKVTNGDAVVINKITIASSTPAVDETAPTLESSDPEDDDEDVETSGTIVLTFSEEIESVDDSKFSLSGATIGTVAIDGTDATKVNVPYTGASNSSTVTLSVAAGAVEDAAGNASAALSNISFTTVAACATTISAQPEDASLTVGGSNPTLSITASNVSSYSWKESSDGTSYDGASSLGSSSTYTPSVNGSVQTKYYYCEVTSSCDGSTVVKSDIVTVTVSAAPSCPEEGIIYKFETKASISSTTSITDNPVSITTSNYLQTLTTSGGSLTAYNDNSNFQIASNGMKLADKSKAYLILNLGACTLKAGDVIKTKVTSQNAVLSTSTSTDNKFLDITKNDNVQTYTLAADVDASTIYLLGTSNGAIVYSVEINRPATITLDATTNGGTAVSPVVGLVGDKVVLPHAFKSGKRFKGWYTDASAGTKQADYYTISASTKLYAQFEDIPASGTIFSLALEDGLKPAANCTIKNATGFVQTQDMIRYATVSGGSAILSNSSTSNHAIITTTPTLKFAGSSACLLITFESALREGDVITTAISGNDLSYTTNSTRSTSNNFTKGSNKTLTITDKHVLEGATAIYLWAGSSSGGELTSLSVSRPVSYTATLSPAEGSTSAEGWTLSDGVYTKSGIPGTASVVLPTMTRSGYKFVKWTANQDVTISEETVEAGEDIAAGASVKLSANTTFTAQWTPTYTVTYAKGDEGADGTMTDSNSPYIEGAVVTLLTNTFTAPSTKEFDAWEVTETVSGDEVTVTDGKFTMPAVAVTVTATWRTPAAHYTITYDKGANGTGSIEAGDKTEDVAFTLSDERFTRDGYLQTGWAESDGGAKAYDLGGSYTDNDDITLYPVWTALDTYTASFACADAAPAGWTFANNGWGAENATVAYVCKFVENSISTPLQTGKTTENDVAFAKDAGAIATYDLGIATTVGKVTGTFRVGSSSAKTFNIEYIGADGSTVLHTIAVNHPASSDWGVDNVNETEIVDNVRYIKVKGIGSWVIMQAFSVKYLETRTKYNVSFAAGTGASGSMDAVQYLAGAEVTLPECTFTAPTGKTFNAWVVTKTAGGASVTVTDGKFTMPEEAVTATATWTAHYTITYDKGANGTGSIEAGAKTEDVAFTLSDERFTRDGYLQTGWAESDGGAKAYDLGGSYTANEDITLYPVWTALDTYTASFACADAAPAGWTFSTDDGWADNKTIAAYVCKFTEHSVSAPGNNGMDENWVAFAKTADAYAIYDLGITTTVAALNVTLYGGSGDSFNETIEYLGSDGTTVKKTYTNALNAGNWKANNISKTDVVADVRYIKVKGAGKWVVMKDFSVKYIETRTKYNVSFAAGTGASGSMDAVQYIAGATVTLPECTFTAPIGKEFDAWVVTKTAGGEEVTVTDGKFTMPAEAVTATATWQTEIIRHTVAYYDGESKLGEEDVVEGETPADYADYQTKDGYVFVGWYNDDDLEEEHKVTIASEEITADANYYGKWALDLQVTKIVFSNGFDAFIKNNTVKAYYMAGESVPTIVSYEGTNLKAEGGVTIDGDNIVLTGTDDSEKELALTLEAVTPMTSYDKQTFDGTETYVKTGNAYHAERKWVFSKSVEEANNKRISEGKNRLYFFVGGSADKVTFTSSMQARAIKVYVNNVLVSSVTATVAAGSTFDIPLDPNDAKNMIAIVSNQTGGDGGVSDMKLNEHHISSDASLSSLTVDGHAVALSEGVYEYTYIYPYGTDPATVPVVAAVANDAFASVGTITQAASTAGTATFTVTAEDETTQDYTVKFSVSRNPALTIYDGKTSDPMDAIAESGSLTPGLEWTITGASTTSASSASAVTFEGKSYTKYMNLFTSATNSTTRYMTITVPENYMAKFRLVGCGNGSNSRSLFISKEITSTVDESIAFVTTTTATIDGMTSDYQPEGTYYLCCNNSIRIYELSVELYKIDYTRATTPGRLGTICLEKGGVMRGAAVYEVAYFNPDNLKIYFDEVIGGVMEPGMPYVFLPDEGNNNQLVVMYGNNAAAAEAGNHNGLYGSFTRENLAANDGNYIFQSNLYWYVNTTNVYVSANRAYIKLAQITGYNNEPEPDPAPGRRRITMGAGSQAPSTATGIDEVNSEELRVKKMLINGQIFIIRGGKMFDATGRLVK